tara:strand:- start:1657 stop:4200 length:2544 start_codon:yes stop_codon:yes gene_type:complete
MKKIVVTGGLGYIGMEISKLYSGTSRINSITVIDNKFYSERVSQLRRWGINYQQIDVLDVENLKKILKDADIIYHLAGITNVPTTIYDKSKKNSNEIRQVGITGTRNIIKYSPEFSKIIFPSTHVIYEGIKNIKKGIKESDEPKPVLEYSTGKYISENDLIKSNKNFVILRLGSVYGMSYDSIRLNIMPNLFSKTTSLDGKIKLHNGGKQLKSLVNVIDVARCMRFVGEDKKINKEIFNCTNEELTVKQVAEICKKFNDKLEIISTEDQTPNNGYTLSNKKIINEGFNFLYNIEDSIKEMINSWKETQLDNLNEIIEIGQDEFIDKRGIISNYYIDDSINMIGYVESKKGSIRGNHYHPVQTQKCLLIKGKYISVTKDLLNPNSVVETRLIQEGDLSTIPPNVAHTMVFLEDSVFLNLVNGEREHENYGMTHTLKFELVDRQLGDLLIKSYKTDCRVCGGGLNHFLSLGLSPLANNLNNQKKANNEMYPLDLNFCKQCFNSQLSVVVPPEKMFDTYLYLSSTSELFRSHFINFAHKLKNDLNLNRDSILVDLGSNDGIFIKPIQELGITSIGVEPAKNVAKIANSNGLKTFTEYFTNKTVNKITKQYGKVDVVTAFNVFAHSDGLRDILENVKKLLKEDGEFIFEIQYFLRTIKDLTFDNIYHEHVNYWCLLSILNFFKDSDMKVYKVEEVNTHGGSLRVYATMNKNKRAHKSLREYIEIEKKNKLDKIETYYKFASDVEKIKLTSLKKIEGIISNNEKIIGYGAPAKATTILNYFGINNLHFDYTIDDNHLKQNKYIPGTNIQIKSIDDIEPEIYDNVVVLAWNFFNEIKRKNSKIFKNAKFLKLK